MATTGLQLLGFVLVCLAWVGMIVTCASPEWRKNSQGQTVLDNIGRYDGLWKQCQQYSTGQTKCESYDAFFIGLPEVLATCRALVICAIGLGFVGLLLVIMGMKCMTVGGKIAQVNHQSKARSTLIGGLLLGVSSACTGASVSYYAHQIVQEYFNPALPYKKPLYLRFEYGSALFVGWVTLVIGVLGSVVICAASLMVLSKISKDTILEREYVKAGHTRLEGLTTQNVKTGAVQQYV